MGKLKAALLFPDEIASPAAKYGFGYRWAARYVRARFMDMPLREWVESNRLSYYVGDGWHDARHAIFFNLTEDQFMLLKLKIDPDFELKIISR